MPALLEQLNQFIDQDTIQQISSHLDTDLGSTQKAVQAALPLLVGALGRQAEQKPEAVHQALQKDHDGSLLDNLQGILGRSSREGSTLADAASAIAGGFSVDRKTVDGSGILGHLLGGRRNAVEAGISRASGLQVSDVSRLLATLAPIVMSALGRVQREQNLGASGVQDLLKRETGELEQSMPQGQGGLMGLLDRDQDGQIMDDVAKIGSAALKSGVLGNVLRKPNQ